MGRKQRSGRVAPGISAKDINWWSIYDYTNDRRCYDARNRGRCSCKRSRIVLGFNHCELEKAIMDEMWALAMGEPMPNKLTVEDVLRWWQYRTCRNFPSCTHKTCWAAAHYKEFVETRIHDDWAANLQKAKKPVMPNPLAKIPIPAKSTLDQSIVEQTA